MGVEMARVVYSFCGEGVVAGSSGVCSSRVWGMGHRGRCIVGGSGLCGSEVMGKGLYGTVYCG